MELFTELSKGGDDVNPLGAIQGWMGGNNEKERRK